MRCVHLYLLVGGWVRVRPTSNINAVPGNLNLDDTVMTPDDLVKFRTVYVCRDMLYWGFNAGAGLRRNAVRDACAGWLIPGQRLCSCPAHALQPDGRPRRLQAGRTTATGTTQRDS